MRFTVASWHRHHADPEWWVAHNGFTTMVSPPPWARQHHRNLALFTPTKEIVYGDYSPAEYEVVYWEILRPKWKAINAWVKAQGDTHVILLCACGDNKFCHRLLIRQLLLKMGAHEIALEDVPT